MVVLFFKLVEGQLSGIRTNSGLSIQNLYELGKSALRGALFTVAFEYFDACLIQLNLLPEKDEEFLKNLTRQMQLVAELVMHSFRFFLLVTQFI